MRAPAYACYVISWGISPIHFASIMGVNLAMGGVTPPYASILYLGMRIGKAEFHEILKPTMTLLILGYVPIVFLVTYWPDLAHCDSENGWILLYKKMISYHKKGEYYEKY